MVKPDISSLFLGTSLAFWLPLNAHEGTHLALERLELELEADSQEPELHLRHARLLIEHGDPAMALAALDQARALAAEPSPCQILRADALIALKREPDAIIILDLLLSDHPAHLPALRLRARAHATAGNTDHAIADCRRITALQAEPDIAFLAADLLVAADRETEAIAFLDTSFPTAKRPTSINQKALEIEINLRDWPAAHHRLDQQIATSARPESTMAKKAETYALAGRHDEASSAWKSLLNRISALAPNIRSSHAIMTLAERAQFALNPSKP